MKRIGQGIRVVAWNGEGNRRKGEKVHEVPASPEDTSRSTTTPMGMARTSMGQTTRRLRWSLYGENVPHYRGCSLQVVGGTPSRSSHIAEQMDKMRVTFATHDLPEIFVTDNGLVFTNQEFETFCKRNGNKHETSSPYHPSTNGLAERAVQTFKTAMKKADSGSLETKVS